VGGTELGARCVRGEHEGDPVVASGAVGGRAGLGAHGFKVGGVQGISVDDWGRITEGSGSAVAGSGVATGDAASCVPGTYGKVDSSKIT
jgi:hypothetical protein